NDGSLHRIFSDFVMKKGAAQIRATSGRGPAWSPDALAGSEAGRRRGSAPTRWSAAEDEVAAADVDMDGVALAELAVEQVQTEGVEKALLDDALQGAGPIGRVVALRGEPLEGRGRELELQALGLQSFHHPIELDLHDGVEIRFAEAIEDDRLVDAVEELGPEMETQGLEDEGFALL